MTGGTNLLNVGNGLDEPANDPDDDAEDIAGGTKRGLTAIRYRRRVKDGQRKGNHPNLCNSSVSLPGKRCSTYP